MSGEDYETRIWRRLAEMVVRSMVRDTKVQPGSPAEFVIDAKVLVEHLHRAVAGLPVVPDKDSAP